MPTREQIITIQSAKRWLMKNRDFTDQAYRILLRNVGRVESSKELGNDGVEQVMAVMEAMGFDQHPRGPRYWRSKAERQGDRAAWKIEAMCAEYGVDCAGFVRRMTNGRTDRVDELDGQEMWRIIEALKVMRDRGTLAPVTHQSSLIKKGAAREPVLFP